MTRSPKSLRLVTVLALALVACSSGGGGDDHRGPDGAGSGSDVGMMNAGSGGGGNSTAGAGGQVGGGSGGSGADSGGSGAGDGGTAEGDAGVCQFMGTPADPSSLPSCESDTCQDAHCLPRSVITPEQADLLADCDDDNECVPDLLIRTLGLVLLQTCESLGGAEGRCISTCVPQVESQIDALPQDECEDGERCAPCYDPITGDDTGACGQGCDEGPTEYPYTFDECCDGVSVCVPEALVPDDQRDMLDAEGCADEGELCAPKAMASDRSFVPESCESLGGAEGRCLPSCLPDVARQADRLPRDSCESGELCAPCFDPLTGDETGACGIAGDEPEDDAYEFPTCCDDGEGNDLGTCVPTALVPEEQRAMLSAETCSDSDFLCAPTTLATGDYEPVSCTSLAGAEGRCMPACLPDVAAQSAVLPVDACSQGYLCAPCYDPITGLSTGSCSLEGDEPEDEPVLFPGCCDDGAGNDLGACVPIALVPVDQQSMLSAETCAGSGVLCAPRDIAAGDYEPETCQSWDDAEGRCLPACLPDVAAQASRLTQDLCDQGKLCVPCYDPLTGESTGSCELEGDEPDDDAYTFPTCCDDGTGNDLGTCVPDALVPEAQLSLLDADSCTGDGFLCAPTDVANDAYTPIDCNSWLGAEGRCLPACLPDVEAQASSLQAPASDGCTQGKLCVPCFSQVDGSSTGACTLTPDAPTEAARIFPRCCPTNSVDRGTCVPALAAGAQAASLPNLNCETLIDDADDYVCAPTEKVVDPAYVFPTACTTNCGADAGTCGLVALFAPATFGNLGRCMASCFLREQATPIGGNAEALFGPGADTMQHNPCPTGEDCAPCINPSTNVATGVCP